MDLTVDNIKLEIFRNRSEMEAQITLLDTGEIVDRIPVSWRSRETKLDYLSVSKIEAYEQCPACFHRQYMSDECREDDGGNIFTKFGSILHEVAEMAVRHYRDHGVVVNTTALYDDAWKARDLADFHTYIEGKDLIVDYFKRNPVQNMTDSTLAVEYEWRGQLGGVTFGLIFDYVGQINRTTGKIKDYKTNRMPFTPTQLDDSLQLRIYEIVARQLWPEIEQWVTGYEVFRYGWQQCPPRSDKDLADAEQYVSNIAHQIQNDNTWEERLNNYCGYRQCRLTCKKYRDLVENPQKYIDIVRTDDNSIEKLERERESITAYEKILKNRKDELSNILRAEVEKHMEQGKPLVIDGKELQLYSNATQSYRFYDTRNMLLSKNKLNMLDECLGINKSKLDKKIKSDPALALELSACMDTNYATPYIVKKKYKG